MHVLAAMAEGDVPAKTKPASQPTRTHLEMLAGRMMSPSGVVAP